MSNFEYVILDRNLPLEAVRVTESAAIATHNLMGRGDEKNADFGFSNPKSAFFLHHHFWQSIFK